MPTVHVMGLDDGDRRGAPVALDVVSGGNLLAAMLESGVAIGNDCGGNAQCATCRVRVDACEFVMPPMGMAEEYALSRVRKVGVVRLACQCAVVGDMSVAVLDVGEG